MGVVANYVSANTSGHVPLILELQGFGVARMQCIKIYRTLHVKEVKVKR